MKKEKLEVSIQEGWAVHIYDHNRHLRCALDASHSWSFVTGLAMGIVVTMISTMLATSTTPQVTQPSPINSLTAPSSLETTDQLEKKNYPMFWKD